MNRRLTLIAAAVAAISMILLIILIRGCVKTKRPDDPPKPGPTGLAIAWNDVEFVEVAYEQAFGPMKEGSGAVEPASEKWRAYEWTPAAKSLVTAGAPPAGRRLIGRRSMFLHAVHAPYREELLAAEGDAWRWNTAEPVGPLPGADILSAVRVPAELELAFKDGGCAATCGGKTTALAAGKSSVVWSGTRELKLAEYLAALKAVPGAALGAADEKRLQGAAKGGVITLHARLVVVFHGPARVAAFDAAAVTRDVEAAIRAGDGAKARQLVRPLLALRPDDDWTSELWRRAVAASTKPKPALVKGRVTFPAPLAGKVPPFVVVRDPAAAAGVSVCAQAAFGGGCEMRVPPGTYVVAARAPGYREISKTVEIAGDCEVILEFTDADRIR